MLRKILAVDDSALIHQMYKLFLSRYKNCKLVSAMNGLEALDKLPEDLSVELIDLRTLHPMDTDTIFASVEKTGRLVIVQEATRLCSLSSEITAQVMERCFLHLQAPVQRVCGFDTIMPYAKLELDYLPNADKIVEAITQVAAY